MDAEKCDLPSGKKLRKFIMSFLFTIKYNQNTIIFRLNALIFLKAL